MPQKTFVQRVASNVVRFTQRKQGEVRQRLYVVTGRERTGDKPAYYVINVPALKEALFVKAWADSLYLNLEEYGEIVESGFGEYAPEELLARFG